MSCYLVATLAFVLGFGAVPCLRFVFASCCVRRD